MPIQLAMAPDARLLGSRRAQDAVGHRSLRLVAAKGGVEKFTPTEAAFAISLQEFTRGLSVGYRGVFSVGFKSPLSRRCVVCRKIWDLLKT